MNFRQVKCFVNKVPYNYKDWKNIIFTNNMSTNYETIVVGLGAAGATAASTLAQAGRKVLALEAQDRVGGRVHTVQFGDGVVELGAEWVHGSDPSRVFDAAVKANISLLAQDLDLTVYQSDGVKPGQAYQDIFNELVEYIFVATAIPSEKPEPLGEYAQRKLIDYLKEQKPDILQDKLIIHQVLDYTHQLMNNYNASNDWNDVNAQGGYEELEGHQHLSWHKHGYKTFFGVLMNKEAGFPTLDIKFNAEVVQIEWPQDPQQKAMVTCGDGAVYTANNVIVTVSLGVLKEQHTTLFKPKLPDDKINAIERISMGVMDKIELCFDRAWWPVDAAFFGFVWKDEDIKTVANEDMWITKVFAASRPMGAKNVLTLWTSGEMGKMVEALPIHEVQNKCMQVLRRFMGANITVPEPTGIERSTWYSNRFTRGSYSFDSIQASEFPTAREDLARPLEDSSGKPRVLFAGEATHATHFSTVHGAADTGYREAARLLPGASKL